MSASAASAALPTLDTLQPGAVATIVSIHTDEALHLRLAALGLRTGKSVTLIRRAALGGPLQVRLGTTDILLRRSEAGKIRVRPT